MIKAKLSGALLTRRDVPPATADSSVWPTSYSPEDDVGQVWGQAPSRSGFASSINKRYCLFGPFTRFGLVICGAIALLAVACVLLMHRGGHLGPKDELQSAPTSSNPSELAPAIGASELRSTTVMSVKPLLDSGVTGHAEALSIPAVVSEITVEEVAALLARGDAQ